ncbi:E3 ubiquitin-protein ligase MIB2-like isoform X1 [Branchiostoma floridae]|uniref:RING-type E3 ubiquitin transferase n=1 Tax=Branchiostoma floridae TaxID=7739 RepID=A0A9J7M9V7_BRAFL|nr:E3 ubiquitin-protein ligase MIB2-like isoform X1 [Branchiostoma floridae]
MEVGLRVIRGPDWKWANQDDGEGHIGTVVEIGRPGSTASPDKTAVVQWDSGMRTNYRVGYQGSYDLLVYDNAPIGVKHPNIICDDCKQHGIRGVRWKCTECHDFDLCTVCYMKDKHLTTHQFERYETAQSAGVRVPKRHGSVKVQSRGIFPGARVVRGPDWDWGNQDGGPGNTGKVIEIRGWDNESGNSVVQVTWSSGATNVYRLGHKGKVDVKYTQDATGGYYYKDHLPKLGYHHQQTIVSHMEPVTSAAGQNFRVGDKVKVQLDVDILKQLQEGHGGWNPKMVEYIGKAGTVHRVTERGDIRVQYDGSSNRWTFHPAALTKVDMFSVGDTVRISDKMEEVKRLQAGHGEWTDAMRSTLGQLGTVQKVYHDGDLRVLVNSQTWTLNPANITMVPRSTIDTNNTMAPDRERHQSNTVLSLLEQIRAIQVDNNTPDKLVSEAAQGHLGKVHELVTKHPDRVDTKSSGKTALQVSCHQGYLDMVKVLILAGASLEVKDDDGDTALHYSAFGNQPEIAELLLTKGANVNVTNNSGCGALHVAVNKSHVRCVRVLLNHNCNINTQDSYGDTALHDAIAKDNRDILDMLLAVPTLDLQLRNNRGFNPLHHASLKGNKYAAEKILAICPQLVDERKDDGYSALHLAALNGHKEVADVLITQGHCEVNILNNRHQTPLLLAVSQGHTSVIELLVSRSANVNMEDEEGDTCLHLALVRQSDNTNLANSPQVTSTYSLPSKKLLAYLPFQEPLSGMAQYIWDSVVKQLSNMNKQIHSSMGIVDTGGNAGAAIACFLVQEGANLNAANQRGQTPMDLVTDPRVKELIQQFASARRDMEAKSSRSHSDGTRPGPSNQSSRDPSPLDVQVDCTECIVCDDNMANVKFEPCNHTIACVECSTRMKKCIKCQQPITRKVKIDGQPVEVQPTRNILPEKVVELERKVREMEESALCMICLERKRNVAFLCGHATCEQCSRPLKHCPMCRKTITKKISLYL